MNNRNTKNKSSYNNEEDILLNKKIDADIEHVLGRGMKRFGMYAIAVISFALLVFGAITLMKVKFIVGIVLLIVVIFGSSILLGIHLEKNAKKKLERYSAQLENME